MGHKNKNKRSLRGRGFCGRIKALLLAGLLVLPIVGNLVVKLDVWADSPTKSVCKTAVLTPSNDGGTTYGIQVCADEYADGTISVTKMTGLADYLDGSGTPVSEITIGKVAIKTKRDFETGNKYQNAWVDFGANGRGTSGSPDDHADDGKNGTSNSSPISNGHVFEASAYKGQGAEAYVNRVLEHVNYWANQWKQDLKIEGGIQGGTKVKEANCVVGAAVNDCSDNVLDYLTDQDKLRIDDISTCYIAEVSRMTSGAGTTIYREIRCDGTNVADVTYSAKTVTESNQTAEQASGNADDPASSGSGGTGSSIAGGGTTSATGGGSGSESAAETKLDCYHAGNALVWIFCPLIEAASYAADFIYDHILSESLKIGTEFYGEDATKNAWSTFRDFANILLVITMLIVIISQITGLGISNLGIKRMLPRLIVTVILINLSYYVCQLAIDVSNILGVGVKGIFDGMANGTTPSASGSTAVQAVFGVIMDSIIGVGIGGGIWAAVGTGAILLALVTLIPAVVGALISILFLFFLLEARKVGVLVLTIVSPVAIMLYVLPNTKRTFDKYTHAFFALLTLYPICGALMGASNFVANLIYSTGTPGFWEAVVAMAVDVMPFFFIPSLTRKSMDAIGGLGSKINGFGRNLSNRASNAVGRSDRYQLMRENAEMRRAGFRRDKDGNWKMSAYGRRRSENAKPNGVYARRMQRAQQAIGRRQNEASDWRSMLGAKAQEAVLGEDGKPLMEVAKDENGNIMTDKDNRPIMRPVMRTMTDENGNEIRGIDAMLLASNNASTIQAEARIHDQMKMADNGYARMMTRQQMDSSDAREASLRNLYAADREFGGEKDFNNAQVLEAAVRGKTQAARLGMWDGDGATRYAERKLTETYRAIEAENVKTEEAGILNDKRWLEGGKAREELIRENMLKAVETDNIALMRAVGNVQDKGSIDNFRNVLNEATRDKNGELYKSLHNENGEFNADGYSLMQNLALSAQGNSVLMSDSRIATWATKSSLVSGTLDADFSKYQFGAVDENGEMTAELKAATDISPEDIRTMDKGFVRDYVGSVAVGETKLSAEQRRALDDYVTTNNYKSSDAERRGFIDTLRTASAVYAGEGISFRRKDGTTAEIRGMSAPDGMNTQDFETLVSTYRSGEFDNDQAAKAAVEGVITRTATHDMSSAGLSWRAESFSNDDNKNTAIEVVARQLGSISDTSFDNMTTNGDRATVNSIIEQAVSGVGSGMLRGASEVRREQIAELAATQLMTSSELVNPGSQSGLRLINSLTSGFADNANAEMQAMSAMIGAKMTGDEANWQRLNEGDRQEIVRGVGHSLGSVASSDLGRILGATMQENGGAITLSGEIVREATSSAATLSSLSIENRTKLATAAAEGGLIEKLNEAQFANMVKMEGLDGKTLQTVVEAGTQPQISGMTASWGNPDFIATAADRSVAQVIATSPDAWANVLPDSQATILRTAQMSETAAETIRVQTTEQRRIEKERTDRLDSIIANSSSVDQLKSEMNQMIAAGSMADAAYVISKNPNILAEFNSPAGADAIRMVANSSTENARTIADAITKGMGQHFDVGEIAQKLVSDQDVYSAIKDNETREVLVAKSGWTENIAKEERDAATQIRRTEKSLAAMERAQVSPVETVPEDIQRADERNVVAQAEATQLRGQAATGPSTDVTAGRSETVAQTLMRYGPRPRGGPGTNFPPPPPGGPPPPAP
ncbi:MAG: hypothetical protein Q4F60_01560 [Candidatus Saccharibacteria bacterium]|nr:hypothetical protein [Candidatus Saccharibacteria bacterium]